MLEGSAQQGLVPKMNEHEDGLYLMLTIKITHNSNTGLNLIKLSK